MELSEQHAITNIAPIGDFSLIEESRFFNLEVPFNIITTPANKNNKDLKKLWLNI